MEMPTEYSPLLIVLSVLSAIGASYTAMDVAGRVGASQGRSRLAWMLGGSIAVGLGIWSMHFVGMIAFHFPTPMGYDMPMMLLSIVVAIVASASAMLVASRTQLTKTPLALGALFMGSAIAGMHYIGMASLHAYANAYDPVLIVFSVAISVVGALFSLTLTHRFSNSSGRKTLKTRFAGAVVMGLIITATHYAGMNAVHFTYALPSAVERVGEFLNKTMLLYAVALSTIVVLAIALSASAVHRNVTLQLLEATRSREKTVRAHQLFLRQIIDASPNLVFVKDWNGVFVLANKALADVYGATVEELEGKTDYDFNRNSEQVRKFHEDDRDVMTGLQLKRISEEPIASKTTGKAMWWQTVKVPLNSDDESERRVLGVATDITDRKLLEDQLRHIQKLEALGQLTGGIAHDLNNVLTVILANADLMAPQVANQTPQLLSEFDDLQNAAARGADMVRKLLAFSRREILQPRPLALDRLCLELQSTLCRLLPATIQVSLKTEARLPAIRADEGALEQILLNLATNARDSMRDGGSLEIDVSRAVIDKEWCLNNGWGTPGDYVCVSLSDTGSGIDPQIRGRIFEPYFTTKPQGEGTGLGLAMVYGLVRQHDGFIGVYSEVDLGTTVRLYFPSLGEELEDRRVVVMRKLLGGTETVLVADDEESIRRSLVRVLERHGYNVLMASNGEEALQIINAGVDKIDLVISDVVMPNMGGKQLLKEMRKAGRTIPFLFTSGYAPRGTGEHLILDPDIPFLHKPWATSDLLQKVREVLDGVSADSLSSVERGIAA